MGRPKELAHIGAARQDNDCAECDNTIMKGDLQLAVTVGYGGESKKKWHVAREMRDTTSKVIGYACCVPMDHVKKAIELLEARQVIVVKKLEKVQQESVILDMAHAKLSDINAWYPVSIDVGTKGGSK